MSATVDGNNGDSAGQSLFVAWGRIGRPHRIRCGLLREGFAGDVGLAGFEFGGEFRDVFTLGGEIGLVGFEPGGEFLGVLRLGLAVGVARQGARR